MGQSAILKILGELQEENKLLREALTQKFAQVDGKIAAVGKGVQFIARTAGIEGHLAALYTADVDNPAQPVPEPGAQAPEETTEEALAGDSANPVKRDQPAGGNSADLLMQPGSVPGSTTNVPADATADVTTPGGVMDTPAFTENQNVMEPVAGTTEQRPLNETKIESDVVAETGDNTTPAFPIAPAFSEQMTTSGNQRFVASLRLARARIAAGITPSNDDVIVAQAINDSDLSDDMIAREVMTLESVKTAQAQRNVPTGPAASRPLSRTTAARTAPSLAPAADAPITVPLPSIVASVHDEESLFE